MAAWLAQLPELANPAEIARDYTTVKLASLFPELTDEHTGRMVGVGCPDGPTGSCPHPATVGVTLEQKIIHLEDCHQRPREYIAAWLQAHGY